MDGGHISKRNNNAGKVSVIIIWVLLLTMFVCLVHSSTQNHKSRRKEFPWNVTGDLQSRFFVGLIIMSTPMMNERARELSKLTNA